MYTDAAVSAYKKRLLERKGGEELNASLRPGDHVIFARLDRGFRNLKDLLNTVDQWIARGIHIHFCDLGLDLTTDFGRLILQILGAVAEWQARYTSARNKEIAKVMKSLGRKGNGRAPMGFKLVGPKGKRRKVVKDEAALAVMQEIVRLRDRERLSWSEISDRIEAKLAQSQGRQPIPAYDQGKRQWTKHLCQQGYEAALALAKRATARAAPSDTPA
jgi:DNA invertase Pin-like site-specific DNA recombinase